jgi:hypothetical protein
MKRRGGSLHSPQGRRIARAFADTAPADSTYNAVKAAAIAWSTCAKCPTKPARSTFGVDGYIRCFAPTVEASRGNAEPIAVELVKELGFNAVNMVPLVVDHADASGTSDGIVETLRRVFFYARKCIYATRRAPRLPTKNLTGEET